MSRVHRYLMVGLLALNALGCDTGETDLRLYAWGSNSDGQLGIGDDGYFQTSPVSVPGVTGVTQLSIHGAQAMVLRSDGTILAWGEDAYGEQGIGVAGSFRATPGAVYLDAQTPLTNLVGISMGNNHVAAIVSGGTLRLWGHNDHGQLGDGSTTDRRYATADPGLTGVEEVDLSWNHSLVRLSNGTLRAFGRGTSGELGDGLSTSSSTPVAVTNPGLPVVECAVGERHNIVRLNDGTIRTWGENKSGQLGDGWTTNRSAPVTVPGLAGLNLIAVAAGKTHSLALVSDGTVRTWGLNDRGQLGNGTTTDSAVPVTVLAPDGVSTLSNVAAVGAGSFNTYAVLNDGTVVGCGSNEYGQLGDGTRTNRSIATPVQGLSGCVAIAGGNEFVVVRLSDGALKAWGHQALGKLGLGTSPMRARPTRVEGVPLPLEAGGGDRYTLFLDSDGTMRACGFNRFGRLGTGVDLHLSTPRSVQVGAADPTPFGSVASVSAGGFHGLALRNDGTMWGWGANGTGQIGDGTTTVPAYPTPGPSLGTVLQYSAGQDGSMAVTSDGRVWTWGANWNGQLGNGSTSQSSVPVSVRTSATDGSPLSGVVAIAGPNSHALAVLSDGTVRAWGYNAYGQLGDGSTTERTSPVTVSGLQNVKAVAVGVYHSLALLQDGTVRAWGLNDWGQLGDGTTATRTQPAVVRRSADDPSPLSSVVAIAAGDHHCVALLEWGKVVTWGLNDSGQLGDGTTQSRSAPVETSGMLPIRKIAAGASHTLAIP